MTELVVGSTVEDVAAASGLEDEAKVGGYAVEGGGDSMGGGTGTCTGEEEDDGMLPERKGFGRSLSSCWSPLVMSAGALTVDGTMAAVDFLVKNEVRAFMLEDDFAFFFFAARLDLHFLLLKCWLS